MRPDGDRQKRVLREQVSPGLRLQLVVFVVQLFPVVRDWAAIQDQGRRGQGGFRREAVQGGHRRGGTLRGQRV